jgi:predicted nuclease of predicted toxin-antitoxin system
MIAFLLDECVSFQTYRLISALGFTVKTVLDITRSGVTDSELFRIAQSQTLVIVTLDRGFGDVRIYPPNSHNGIIVLKAYDLNSLQKCHTVLEMLLKVESEFKGNLFIVDGNKYRKKK